MPTLASAASKSGSRIAWIGGTGRPELAWAKAAAASIAPLQEGFRDAWTDEALVASPTVTLLATDRPGRFVLADAVAISRRWPLTVPVSVATSLADGRRRSGPPLPGIEEVPWCDLPGRLRFWLAGLEAGRPGLLGLPATCRREDRLFEAATEVRDRRAAGMPRCRVAVAAGQPADLDGLVAMVTAIGHEIAACHLRRPPVDVDADLLLWDAEALDATQLSWLRLLTANRPGLPVVLLDSFPHHDTARAAFAAGADAVLSRPLSLEALAGTLLARERAASIGVGPPAGAG